MRRTPINLCVSPFGIGGLRQVDARGQPNVTPFKAPKIG